MKSKNGKSGGSGRIKPKPILIAGSVLVLGYLALKTQSTKEAPTLPTKEAVQTPQNLIIETPREPKAYDTEAYTKEVKRVRAQAAARTLLGLKTLELKEENGLLTIPFRFTPRKLWCQGGDLDMMKYASNNITANEILISLEPTSGGKGDYVRTSVAALYNGLEGSFKLNAGSKQSYGLYICSDDKKGTSCKGKAVASAAGMTEELAKAGNSPKKSYIFYFQHVVLDKRGLETYKSDDPTDEFKKSIGTYLNKQKDLDSSEFEAAWKVSKVIRSTPSDVYDGRLQLSLPYGDTRCMRSDRSR